MPKKSLKIDTPKIEKASVIINALADKTNIEIIKLLLTYKYLCQSHIYIFLNKKQTTISSHINKLKKAGIINVELLYRKEPHLRTGIHLKFSMKQFIQHINKLNELRLSKEEVETCSEVLYSGKEKYLSIKNEILEKIILIIDLVQKV